MDAMDQELNELRREFLGEARRKVDEMHAAVSEGMPTEGRERIAYLAHQLKGSGGSYGFPPISDQAVEIERIVNDTSASDASAVEQKVSELRAEIDRCVNDLENIPMP